MSTLLSLKKQNQSNYAKQTKIKQFRPFTPLFYYISKCQPQYVWIFSRYYKNVILGMCITEVSASPLNHRLQPTAVCLQRTFIFTVWHQSYLVWHPSRNIVQVLKSHCLWPCSWSAPTNPPISHLPVWLHRCMLISVLIPSHLLFSTTYRRRVAGAWSLFFLTFSERRASEK